MRRRDFLRVSAAALGTLAIGSGLHAGSADRPNIIVILVDDLGFADLSSYGADDLRTPNIDRIVSNGMRFDRFYANCPVCSPTRAALLTGHFPPLAGVPGVIRTHADNSWGYLSPRVVLLPKLLKQAGYSTALVGKWHLGLEEPNLPNSRGFDRFHGWLGDMMDDYYAHRRHGINYMRLNEQVIDPKGHATDLFTEWACDYIAQQKDKGPFFLYLAYNAPHDPIQPPKDYLDRMRQRNPKMPEKRAKLAALIEHLDAGIGRVMEALDKSGQRENTLVIFTSDNGGSLGAGAHNGKVRAGKSTVYEGGLRVPMAARWPGHIRAGSRSNLIALTMDIMPTALEAAGVKPPADIDGRSFLSALLEKEQPWPQRDLFFTMREGGGLRGGTIDAIRRGDWKLLRSKADGKWQLYNLADDPLEMKDVAAANPAKVAELSAALQAYFERCERVPWKK